MLWIPIFPPCHGMQSFWTSFSGRISLGQGGMPIQGGKSLARGPTDLGSDAPFLGGSALH